MNHLEKSRKAKVGFLFFGSRRFKPLGVGTSTGTYDERVNRERIKFTQALNEELEIIDPGIVYEADDLKKAMQMYADEHVDCILAVFLSWAEDNLWITYLRDSDQTLPIIYYCPSKEHIPFSSCVAEDDFIEFLASGGLVGMLVGSGSIPRYKKNVKVVVGSLTKKSKEIVDYAKTCMVYKVLQKSRFGIMPAYNEIMWNTYIDPYRFFSFGPELNFISYDELAVLSDAIPLEEITAFGNALKEKYPMDENIDEEKFIASLRYSLGLSKIVLNRDLDVLTINDVDMRLFETIGLRPGFYPDIINALQSVLCPEADLGVALSLYILKLFSKNQVNIVEPFYIDESRGIFCGGHAGPNDYNYPQSADNVRISIDTRFAKTSYRYAGAPFAWLRIPPGEMTMVHISQIDGNLKLIASTVESIEGPLFINSYTHSEFKPINGKVDEFFEKLLSIGTTQHFAVTPGNYVNACKDLAKLCGFEFHVN